MPYEEIDVESRALWLIYSGTIGFVTSNGVRVIKLFKSKDSLHSRKNMLSV